MMFSKPNKALLLKFIERAKRDPGVELECLIRGDSAEMPLDQYRFLALLQYMRSTHSNFVFYPETLNVNFEHNHESYRIEVEGSQAIETYCKNDYPQGKYSLIKKTWVDNFRRLRVPEYSIAFNMKEEKLIDTDTEDALQIMSSFKKPGDKTFRLKKRFSFFSDDDLFRLDMTIVKMATASSFALSDLLETSVRYEVEVEYLGNKKKDVQRTPNDLDIYRRFLEFVGMCLLAIDEDDYLLSNPEKKAISDKYLALADKCFKVKRFIGPMPVTLERKNMYPVDLSFDTILKNYTVTDKADGERYILYIADDHRVYLINNRMNVRFMGCTSKVYANTVLDGEYITRTSLNTNMKMFAVFDAYTVNGNSVSELPLALDDNGKGQGGESRLSIANQVVSAGFIGDDSFKVVVKKFYANANILDEGAKLIIEADLPYHVDGLIFTPKSLAVGAVLEGGKSRFDRTWNMVYKWKPPSENTIDFLVKVEKNEFGQDIITQNQQGDKQKMISLYVGYQKKYTERISPLKFIEGTVTLASLNEYYPELFVPTDAIYKNISQVALNVVDGGHIKCKNGDVILHNSVVEFSYDTNKKTWRPNRVRSDKTMGNDYQTAINIWRSIHNPVTEEMVMGILKVVPSDADQIDDDMYYDRQYDRNMSATKPMIDFHNDYVKNKTLIARFKGKVKSVFDIACGKGNDFYKYLRNDIRTIVGVDKSEDNIMNGRDGAFQRLMTETKKDRGQSLIKPNDLILALPMDMSIKINASSFASIDIDEDTKEVMNVLWDQKQTNNPKLRPYQGLVSKRFDLVACQFAVHYFFEKHDTLKALIDNLDSVIAPGGYFMGTCLDGSVVDKAFTSANVDKGERISGEKAGRTIWSLTKQYDSFDVTTPANNIGKRIDVYMETINKQISEYLVDFKLLETELAQRGIRLLNKEEMNALGLHSSTGLFGSLFTDLETSKETDRFTQSAKQMTDEEKRYSFMNRWFVFRKDEQTAATLPSTQPEGKKKLIYKRKT
jgi:SAM-dependent methyltransferase